eukprot:CAMPEP_0197529316 /NCGR_PEP_ID=MMETSP1318-20131121/27982_1 /TAXON_ID=552666 /ORGANISM="Partenskyella glossopodia, Strain RCC365" /LENGTH=212 /DNA_ID=CAMNT_0043084739 /DNA_START=65 /DNA_END=703 /DNA_ORIENTATION=+
MGCDTSKNPENRSSGNAVVVFVLGGPGTGKGTQCGNVLEEFPFVHLSAGDLLRAERKRPESKLGEMINSYISEGKIVPSNVTVSLILQAIQASQKEGKRFFLVDGFPRSMENFEAWQSEVGNKATVATTIFFTLDEDEMVQRILHRAKTSGRNDDNIDVIKKRLKTFHESTVPVLAVLKESSGLREIEASGTKDEVYAKVKVVINDVIKSAS